MAEVKRLEFIDIFKAIGIIFMLMGHVGFGQSFAHYISAFHMPMFFFISGYLFKTYDFKDLIKRKFNGLLKPYLYFGLLNAVLCLIFVENFKLGTYFEKFFFFNNRHLPVAGALWFLTGMFFANILFWLFHKYINKYFLGIVLSGVAICEYYLKLRIPFSIDSALFMLPVMYSGYLFKRYESDCNKFKTAVLGLFFFVVSYFLIFQNGICNVRSNVYSNLGLFYLNAILATLAYFYLSKFLCSILSLKCLQYVGRNSLNYLALNQIVIKLVPNLGGGAVLCFIISMIIISVLSELVNKVKKWPKIIFEYFQGARNLIK